MSHQQVPPDPELSAIEAALGSLEPARSRLDRDRLMFLTGQNSVRTRARRRWAWPSVAATLAVVALSEAAILAYRLERQVVEPVVASRETAPPRAAAVAPTPAPARLPTPAGRTELASVVILSQAPTTPASWAPEPLWPAETEYVRLRRLVLRFGLDGLPEPAPLALQSAGHSTDARPVSSGALLQSEIAKLLNPREPS